MKHKRLCFLTSLHRKEVLAIETLSKEYVFLFNTIARTQQELQRLQETLVQAQRTAEELYLERGEVSAT